MHFPGLSCTGSGSWALHKAQTQLRLCFVPFLGPSSSGDQVLGKRALPAGWWCLLSLPWSQSLNLQGVAGAPSQVCHVSPLGSWSLTATLLEDVNCPGSQEDLVNNWEPAHSLVENASSGAEIAPCLPALSIARLPLYLWQGGGAGPQPASSLLIFAQSFVLWAGLAVP